MHAHTPIYEFQPPGADEPLHRILDNVALLPPPPLEKCLLDVDELAVLVPEQRRHERIQHVLNARALDGVVGSDVVLVDGLEPADVVVGVGDDVHVQLPVDHPRRRVVGDVRRLDVAGQKQDGGEEEEEGEPDGAHGRRRGAERARWGGRGEGGGGRRVARVTAPLSGPAGAAKSTS